MNSVEKGEGEVEEYMRVGQKSTPKVDISELKDHFRDALGESLGLSEYEGKVYTALVFCGTMDPPTISQKSGVPLQRVYQIIRSLTQKGFVLSTGTKPKRYTAQNPRVIFSRRYERIREIIAKSEEAYEAALFHPESYMERPIWNLETTEDILLKLSDLLRRSKQTIIGTSHDFSWMASMDIRAEVESALKRDVMIQAIGFSQPDKYPDVLPKLKGENFQVRRHKKRLPIFMIADSSEVIIAVQKPSANLVTYYAGVWIRNELWAGFLEECFRDRWQESQEVL